MLPLHVEATLHEKLHVQLPQPGTEAYLVRHMCNLARQVDV